MLHKQVLQVRLQKVITAYIQQFVNGSKKLSISSVNIQRSILWLMAFLFPIILILIAFNVVAVFGVFTLGIAITYLLLIAIFLILNYER